MVSRSKRFVASLAVLSIAAAGAGQQALAAPPSPELKAPQQNKQDQVVTLLTGDRVTLHGGDLTKPSIEPGQGREGIKFSAHRVNGQLFVIPSDVNSAVTSGQLDRRLFDVAGLVKAGYDDKASKVIPLIVTYQGKANRSAPAGATVSRPLPVVNGAALKVDKKNAAAFLTGVRSSRSAAGIDKIWLDAKRHTSLDQSVPQIGAPAAWQAGYTGKGISVAVLDTGIDATHPDLAPQVAGAKNFTTDPDGDQVGHGTHVASTIAGTAAASAGKYKGVAPDAKLYDGKVCEQGGCPDSAILAGMEWAANEVKAKVVNISLGGQDTPELDPIEEAVNTLTASTGTLFVIAAGNSGPGAASIESPGSADAALTVGAVDKQDKLADFSSRGPRVGDGAIKPDVTAPGVDIVAARSKDGQIGDPVGDKYVRLSGTSMATPHTVGAAALLAQQHPSWKANELKGALMASAKAATDQSTFEQGAGRVDVAKAIKQNVIAEPGSVSFGTAQWPHTDDTPVTKDVSFRNLGDQSVTLTLTAELTDPTGAPAPAGALKLSATTVTVPAGGTASVQATSNTNHSGPDGGYSGRIVATADGVNVVAPIGVDKEVESYTVTIKHVGLDGNPTGDSSTLLFGLDSFRFDFLGDPSGTVQVRLPKGEYLFQGDQFVQRSGTEFFDSYSMLQPSLKLTGDTTLVMDARKAKKVTTTIPDQEAKTLLVDLGYDRSNAAGTNGLGSSLLAEDFSGVYSEHQGPALPADQLTGHLASFWAKPTADGSFRNLPLVYGLLSTKPGTFFTGFGRAVKDKDLGLVEQSINATSERAAERVVFSQAPGVGGSFTPVLEYDLPTKAKLRLEAKPVSWQTEVSEVVPNPDPENPFPLTITQVRSQPQEYRAGKTYRERYNAAAFVPAPGDAVREGNNLFIGLYGSMDADGNGGFTATDTASTQLFRDGKVVYTSDEFGYAEAVDLPAEKGAFKLVTSYTRPSLSGFSTRTDLALTFSSAGAEEVATLPMRTVRYQPAVDDQNTVKRTPVTVLPVLLNTLPGAKLPAVKKLEVRVSGDDGKTWQKAAVVRVGQGYQAIFATPKGKTVSLKAHLVDAGGNTTDQTTIAAYPLR